MLWAWLAVVTLSHGAVVTYIDKIDSWWPPAKIAADIGIPGYAKPSKYTHVNMAFWTRANPVDVGAVWADPLHYVASGNPWGATNKAIWANWTDAFHKAGVKVMISAFGATDYPTPTPPGEVCSNLAKFVVDTQLDGVDIDYEDDAAMNVGTAEAWLINCTRTLRQTLPKGKYVITHAPQAPWFMGTSKYPGGGYLTVDKEVGDMIDWYNVQFYNQGSSKYETYGSLFEASDGWAKGTSVGEMIKAGIPASRIAVGKPVTSGDATNTGYVPLTALKGIIKQAVAAGNWKTGVMGWQYASDMDGAADWSSELASVL